MKIGIIGYGFVGKALAAGLNDDVNLLKIDPKLNTKINDLIDFKPNAIFICVPTPMNEDFLIAKYYMEAEAGIEPA